MLCAYRQASYLEILLTAGKALGPKIRRFLRLGLNRVWLRAGEYAFRQGEPANCLFINISGRLQSLNHEPDAVGGGTARPVVESEWGRGEVMGGLELAAGGVHHSSARAVRDCELVRMSQGAWRVILTQVSQEDTLSPKTASLGSYSFPDCRV
jgi:lysophospholipid hydrolase